MIIMKKLFLSSLLFATLFVLCIPNISHANVAPIQIPGQTLIPLEQNVMRMATTDHIEMTSEEILIDISILDEAVHKGGGTMDSYLWSNSQAAVTASFQLKNTSKDGISDFLIGFPFGTGGYTNEDDQTAEWMLLRNLHVYIDGSEVAFEKKFYNSTNESSLDPESEPWAVWTMDFGKGELDAATRDVKLTYDLYSTDHNKGVLLSENNINLDENSDGSALFYYILHTGRGWKGSIGSTTVRVKVPSEIPFEQEEFTDQYKRSVAQTWDLSPTTFTLDTEKHEIVWHFTNWEPTIPSKPFYGLPMDDPSNPNIVVEFMYPETSAVLKKYFTLASTTPLKTLATAPTQQNAIVETTDAAKEKRNLSWLIGAAVLGVLGGGAFVIQKISSVREEKQ